MKSSSTFQPKKPLKVEGLTRPFRPPKTPKYFIIDGKVYNLEQWIPKHPGGAIWFHEKVEGRDISMAVHAYHKDG